MAGTKTADFSADLVDLAEVAKALGHPGRLEILRILAGKACICGDIVDRMPLSQSTVSQHLKELKKVGLIRGEIEGPRTCYCLDSEAVQAAWEKFTNLFENMNCCGNKENPMKNADEIKDIVKTKYGEIARQGGSCCGPSGCCDTLGGACFAEDYQGLDGYFPEADLGLGCGIPTEYAGIQSGQTVIDLGSGAGNDVFVVRALVGGEGRVIGLDMVPDMVAKARANAAKLDYDNVEFHLGEIEDMPLESDLADVLVSNCVLNLVPGQAEGICRDPPGAQTGRPFLRVGHRSRRRPAAGVGRGRHRLRGLRGRRPEKG